LPNYFNLTLDTVGPQNPSISINSGAVYTGVQLVSLTLSATGGPAQMKIWGNVDTSYDVNIQATEGASTWITFTESKQIKLASGDGNKTIYVKFRDDVWNESDQASDTITLDTTHPVVTISAGPDVSKISKVSGRDTAAFSFKADSAFVEYKVKLVPSTASLHTAGTTIGTTYGSTNMSGTGSYPANTPINCTIKGADFEAAGADTTGEVAEVVKVFTKDAAGNWST
jgi:hypothetical protein